MGNVLRLELFSTLLESSRLSQFYSSLPETKSCVVSLVNTKPICDRADWITQFLLETMLEVEEVHEFVALATESVKAQSLRYETASEGLEKGRVQRQNRKHPGVILAGITMSMLRRMVIA